jgi:hypothetical protein
MAAGSLIGRGVGVAVKVGVGGEVAVGAGVEVGEGLEVAAGRGVNVGVEDVGKGDGVVTGVAVAAGVAATGSVAVVVSAVAAVALAVGVVVSVDLAVMAGAETVCPERGTGSGVALATSWDGATATGPGLSGSPPLAQPPRLRASNRISDRIEFNLCDMRRSYV